MNNDTSETPLKKCRKCGRALPATIEYFHMNRGHLCSPCKECKQVVWRSPEHIEKQWLRRQAPKVKESNRQRIREKRKDPEYRMLENAKSREWKRRNANRVKEYMNLYRGEHQEELLERSREYMREYNQDPLHKEQAVERVRAWRLTNPDKKRIHNLNRRGRECNLPDTLTAEDWQRAVDYFHGCCAVCGRQANDLFDTHTLAADHWIALADQHCPGTIPTNIIPLCHGKCGCNNSKRDREAKQWLIETYGKRKAKQILDKIDTYFEWVKTRCE